jgi:hypothetical protein
MGGSYVFEFKMEVVVPSDSTILTVALFGSRAPGAGSPEGWRLSFFLPRGDDFI